MASISDKAYRARKVAQNRIAAKREAIESGVYTRKEQAEAKAEIRELQRMMQLTKAQTKSGKRIKSRTTEKREAAIANLLSKTETMETVRKTRATVTKLRTDIARSNKITQEQLNLASLKSSKEAEKEGKQVGKYTSDEVKRFYRATQKLWENAPEHMRNEAIMQALDFVSLEDAVAHVLNETQKRSDLIEKIREGYSYDEMTEEEQDLYNSLAGKDSADEEKPSE